MSTPDSIGEQIATEDRLDIYRCNLDGIVIDSLIPANTSGGFCDLLIGTHPTAGKLALKRPRKDCSDERVLSRIEAEAGVWTHLRSPRILQFLGIHRCEGEIYLVSRFAHNGSLPGFIKRNPTVDRKRLVVEIAEGLAYLHRCGIIHGDLKGNNVLISHDAHVLICDFGLAKHVTSRTATSLRGIGSIPWQSPELLHSALRRTLQSDVYAFGITVYEVLSGNEPYSTHTGIGSIITAVLLFEERPPLEPLTAPDGASYLQFWEEARKCWATDANLRPSMVRVLLNLDRKRGEAFVTSYQLNLEAQLDSPDLQGPPSTQDAVGTDTREPLESTRSIHATERIASRSRSPSVDSPNVTEVVTTPRKEPNPLDHHIRCNGCNVNIVGPRYQCANCPSSPVSYNLCDKCEPSSFIIHPLPHVFLKFNRRLDHPVESLGALLPIIYDIPPDDDIMESNRDLASFLHSNTYCDLCMTLIRGVWYRCGHCNMDLCDFHEQSHDEDHSFILIKTKTSWDVLRTIWDLENPNNTAPLLQPVFEPRQ